MFFLLNVCRAKFINIMGVVDLIFKKRVRDVLLSYVLLILIWNLLFEILMVGIYCVIKGNPILLCLMSVICGI